MVYTETCYRHPDRLTGTHCTRCGRPVCSECMIEAPVGHHCPTCVKDDNKGRRPRNWRPATTQLGGPITPTVKVLVALNVVIYLLTSQHLDANIERFGQLGYALDSHGQLAGVAHGEYYRLITSAFLHLSIPHILLNMIALLIVGSPVEAAIGRVRFLTLYFLAALGGSVASYLFANPATLSVGASGAIFGLFGAFFIIARSRRADTSGILVLIGINLAFSFSDKLIDWRAHVGGLVIGLVVAGVFTLAERRLPNQKWLVEAVGCAAVLFLLIALVSVRTQNLSG
jgi:membrane associated rhomboid family serine protease